MTATLKLVIGNKNYSSWSMRPWVLLRQAGIDFEEIQLKFDDNAHARGIESYSPTGQVPVLIVDGAPVWDSLAICETIAEMFPHARLWPADPRARALARSVCAEMHAGVRYLRTAMPMNIRASLPGKGMTKPARRDIERVLTIWSECRGACGGTGELLFGSFTVADAYYAPIAMRFITYDVPLPAAAREYVQAVRELPSVAEWMRGALQETEFVLADEPYANNPHPPSVT